MKITKNNFDFIIVGYPAYIDFFFIYTLKPKIRKKLYIDFFLSLYDTAILDRQLYKKNSIISKFIYILDKRILKKCDHIIVDTNQNIKRYRTIFNIDSNKFKRIIVGSRLLFEEINLTKCNKFENGEINIGWVGTFIPLHGLKDILKLAINNPKIHFHIIGAGQEFNKVTILVDKQKIKNITLYGKKSYIQTMNILYSCDICLGIFGESEKAKSVIPYKIFDYMCLQKNIITKYDILNKEGINYKKIYSLIEKISFIQILQEMSFDNNLQNSKIQITNIYNNDLNNLLR